MLNIKHPIMVHLIEERSSYTNRITFRLRFYNTVTHKFITALSRKLDFYAWGQQDVQAFIRAQKEKEKAQVEINEIGYDPDIKKKKDFIVFMEGVADQKDYGTRLTYINALGHLKKFIKADALPFEKVDEDFMLLFRKYVLDNCNKTNTASNIFTRVNAVAKMAIRRKLIREDIIIRGIELVRSPKDYLTYDEVLLLLELPWKNIDIKRAFLFSCISGLRTSDLKTLTWGNIIEKDGGYILSTRTQKTNQRIYNHLNPIVTRILGAHGNRDEKVFPGLAGHSAASNYQLRRWIAKAGINKHISMHCARVTYGALIMEITGNIYAVKEALGHKSILSTAWGYSHLRNDIMKMATSLEGLKLKKVYDINGPQMSLPFSAN